MTSERYFSKLKISNQAIKIKIISFFEHSIFSENKRIKRTQNEQYRKEPLSNFFANPVTLSHRVVYLSFPEHKYFRYVSCLCKAYYQAKDPDHWANIAWSLALPYDKELDYHPQFEGYTRGEEIKQADAVLLGFPLQYPMNL